MKKMLILALGLMLSYAGFSQVAATKAVATKAAKAVTPGNDGVLDKGKKSGDQAKNQVGKAAGDADKKLKADGTPDRRYKENKNLKKDGTPDKRFKENKGKQ